MNKRQEALLEFYKKDPDDPFILYGLALEYIQENNLQQAEEYFKELMEKHPDYVPGYMQYARLMEKENNIEKAKELYKKGIEEANKSGDKKAAKEMEDFLDELN
jgi:tetratricopeptide (TPR) repeat protein